YILSLITSPLYDTTLFFYTTPSPTEIYTLSLHDALPIWLSRRARSSRNARRSRSRDCTASAVPPSTAHRWRFRHIRWHGRGRWRDRKSTRLNSSHSQISYAVFCLKKKKKKHKQKHEIKQKHNHIKIRNRKQRMR